MVHLAIGHRLLDLCPDINDKNAFLLGTISPDAIMFRPGCQRSDKSTTHFCLGDEEWGHYTNYENWQDNLLKNLKGYTGAVDKDFLFGYMAHVVTDIESLRCFCNPIRLSGGKSGMARYIDDCREIDSILLNDFENINELWLALESANKHCLADLYSVRDNSLLIDEMKSKMYHNRFVDPDYVPSIFTLPRALQFIEAVTNKIMELS